MGNSRGPTPPLSRSQSNSFLPSHVQQQQQAETTQLLHPLAIVQQQQVKVPRGWPALLQQLVSRKAAAVFYVLLALVLVWYVAAGRHKAAAGEIIQPQPTTVAGASSSSSSTTVTAEQLAKPAAASRSQDSSSESSDTKAADTSTRGQQSTTSAASSSSSSGTVFPVRCPYGALPGTWVSSAPTGAKWQLLDPNCQLKNWLAVYAAAVGAADSNSDTAAAAAAAEDGDSDDSDAELLPMVNMLLLSDSVDRYIVQHVCDYLRGVKHTIRARQQHMHPAVPEPAAAAGAAGAAVQETAEAAPSSSSSSSSSASGPSNLNATAYAFHTCQLPEGVPLKLASSYFPGVHPTGPFHRGLTQNYAARIDAAAALWEEYAGAGQPPHVVSVASALWDVARLWLHERQQLEGPELSRPLLDGWVANFSAVVQYSQQQLPQTQLWLTHTTMLPAHDVITGAMAKPYLGRRYFIEQLNAAAAAAARQLDIQLVDYAAVSSRFREGQQHLADLIHPNAEVALEVFSVLLNLALEPRGL